MSHAWTNDESELRKKNCKILKPGFRSVLGKDHLDNTENFQTVLNRGNNFKMFTLIFI